MTGAIQLQLSLDQVQDATRNWYQDCLFFALNYITMVQSFTSENLIECYEKLGNPKPSEIRVWGAVIRELKSRKLIKHNGFTTYKKPQGHCKPVNVWKVI